MDTSQKSAKRAKPRTVALPKKKSSDKKAKSRKAASSDSEAEPENAGESKQRDTLSEDEDAVAGPSTSATPRSNDDSESDEEGDPSKLIHESLLKDNKSKGGAKKKYVPAEETPEQRDARTIFIGNVPTEVVTSRPLQKQLKRHILSFVPTAKIESTRFRSVAFSKPTAPSSESKDGRQHNRDRAASWRNSRGSLDDEEANADRGKTFLRKRRRTSGLDNDCMDPYEAAKVAIKEADGSVFNGHSLRVDSALRGKGKGKAGMWVRWRSRRTRRLLCLWEFDFACKEEDVRAFFEKVMVEERGAPGEGEAEEETKDGEKSSVSRKAWVKRVRIIRDKDTLLGKGFGYVQFADRSCVDEILALEESRLKFAKRKLRVQRCKTLPGASKPIKPSPSNKPSQSSSKQGKPERTRPSPTERVVVPKGDPTLGTKIASLSKEDRKKVKSSDADRVARRLAKKKAKALAEKGVKSRDGAGGKNRERVRKSKRPGKEGAGAPEKKKAKSGRVRSGAALAKMNRKK
ncbi:hypothetical protein BC629DRAFT_1442025 [Irpex lacteus]|nr:hypothetical protein BC629DRAFT_1442025 [Irpex lacteus]